MIKTYIGPMFSGKTNTALTVYKKIWNKSNIVCFKPKIDTRDYGLIKSRDFQEGIPAICIERLEEILNHISPNTKTIFIDEAQFLVGSYRVLSYLSIVKDIDIHIVGLNLDVNQEPFGIMPQILAISDEIHHIKAVCYDCNKDAEFTYYDGEYKGIEVGDNNYLPLCRKCLIKRLGPQKISERYKLILRAK